jgi:ABC-type sugar transport system ATPase subunit
LEEILEVADRVTVLRDGAKVKELDAKATNVHEMVKYMVGHEIEEVKRTGLFDPTHQEVVLEVEHLSRSDEFEDVSFKLHAGEILGLAGLVGAGRTELMKSLYGDTVPDSGTITLRSNRTFYTSPKDAIHDSLAYVPEERRQLGLFPIMSVTENMTMPILQKLSRFFHINRKRQTSHVHDYVQKLDIKTADVRQQIQNLSGGNQQKVILARWLLTGCQILILDEPTRGIDVNAKAEIHQLLKDLVKQGISIIFISSELQEVIDIADRILIMHEGNIKGEVLAHQTNQEEVLRIALSS